MKTIQIVFALVFVCAWSSVSTEEIIPSEEVQAAETPVAPVETAPLAESPAEAVAPSPVAVESPVAVQSPAPIPAPAPVQAPISRPVAPSPQGLSGTTTETKNPDGSIITVTHFKGQLPQQTGYFQPYGYGLPPWGGFQPPNPYFYPWASYPQFGGVKRP